MKKLALIFTLIAVFTLSTINIVSAKPGKSNPGQDKKAQVTTNAKQAPGQAKKVDKDTSKRDTTVNPGQSKKITTPGAVTFPQTKLSNIKLGRLQLPVGPLKAAGAKVFWDGKSSVIIIEKGTVRVVVEVKATGKKTTVVLVNGKELVQKGNGVINPTKQILSLLGKDKPSTTPGGVTTTPGGVTTTPGGVTTTPGGVTTTPGGVTTTPGGVSN